MQIREKIVDGRIAKIKAQQALLEQAFIRAEDGSSVADAVKSKIAELGEKISVRRFVRYDLGEGLAKKEEDFAAEVAAQTAKKEDEPAPAPAAETKVRSSLIIISASIIDLRHLMWIEDAAARAALPSYSRHLWCSISLYGIHSWFR